MRTTSWLVLAAVTIVTIAAAGYVVEQQQEALNTAQGGIGLLYPGLLAKVNDVHSITVGSAKQSFTITRPEKGDGPWVMAQKENYPADPDQVKAAVVGIAGLKTVAPRTDRPDLYDEIGVADIDKPDSSAIQLVLKNGAGKTLAALLVGKTSSYATDTSPALLYARKVGDRRSWLVQGRLDAHAESTAWLKTQILQVPRTSVMQVDVTPTEGPAFTLARPTSKEENFAVSGLPKGVNPKITNVNGIAAALDLVTFDDVTRADKVDFAKAALVIYHTFDGLVVTVHTATYDHKPWTSFAAAVDPVQAAKAKAAAPTNGAAKADAAAPTSEAAKADAAAPTSEAAKADAAPPAKAGSTGKDAGDPVARVTAEAAAINARVAGWAYQLPDYRVVNFTRTLAAVEMKGPTEVEKDETHAAGSH